MRFGAAVSNWRLYVILCGLEITDYILLWRLCCVGPFATRTNMSLRCGRSSVVLDWQMAVVGQCDNDNRK